VPSVQGGTRRALRDQIQEQLDGQLGVAEQAVTNPRGGGDRGVGGDLQQLGAGREVVAGAP
jgi:hypothetical protein